MHNQYTCCEADIAHFQGLFDLKIESQNSNKDVND